LWQIQWQFGGNGDFLDEKEAFSWQKSYESLRKSGNKIPDLD
jgi:hypothetical protein